MVRRVWLISLGFAVALATLAGTSSAGSSRAVAQGRTAVLTAVGADGTLRMLDGDHWVDVWPDVGHGSTVTDLAWHPTRPELLVVRRAQHPEFLPSRSTVSSASTSRRAPRRRSSTASARRPASSRHASRPTAGPRSRGSSAASPV